MKKSEAHLFQLAHDCSLKSDYTGGGRAHIGAVVSYKGAVLAKGWNSDKTHTIQSKLNVNRYKDEGTKYLPAKVHAEAMALQKIKYLDIDFSKVKLFIYREFTNGNLAMCRPCPACMAAAKAMGIKNIYYTTEDGYCHEKIEVKDE
jgi:tRNA(Arg) A34 adenosine deaminase TadA